MFAARPRGSVERVVRGCGQKFSKVSALVHVECALGGGLIFFLLILYIENIFPKVAAAAPGSRRSRRRLLHACAHLGVPVGTLRVDVQDVPVLGCAGTHCQHACAIVITVRFAPWSEKGSGNRARSPLGAIVLLAHCAHWYSMVLLHGFISLTSRPMSGMPQPRTCCQRALRRAERKPASSRREQEN